MTEKPIIERILSPEHLDDLLADHLVPLVPSGWHELVPVARWLISATRPRVFVELGSHAGVSFSAFCDSMRRRGVAGKAYAVDTWAGDEHAGHYDDSVYESVRELTGKNFPDFTHLLRMTFDEALPEFTDGTVDLLHIDGFHTYEAVRHDFETWKPKLSERGVVLFHDVNCRNPGFGVWRYWEELQAAYPSFEWPHGNGLGLIAVGADMPDAIRDLVSLGEKETLEVRRIFAEAGRPLGRAYEANNKRLNEIELLQNDRNLIDLDRSKVDARRAELELVTDDLQRDLERTQAELKNLRRLNERMLSDRKITENKLFETSRALEDTQRRFDQVQRELSVLTGSKSWQITRPLRAANARLAPQRPRIAMLKRAASRNDAEARTIVWQAVKRRVGLAPPLTAETAIAPPPPRITAEDRETLNALTSQGKIPAVDALVLVADADARRLGAVVAALDAQVLPPARIVLAARPGGAAARAVEELRAARPDLMTAAQVADSAGESAAALLVLSASATPRPEAVAVFAAELAASNAALVYADEIFVAANGRADEPFYKPDFSPRLSRASRYIGSCALLAPGLRPLADLARLHASETGSDTAALLTGIAAQTPAAQVVRTPFVLFEESDERRRVLPPPAPVAATPRRETVSIIIPTRDRLSLVEPCITSILERTDYPRESYEIVVVDNGSVDPATLDYLGRGAESGLFSVIRDDSPFNYARLNNLAARASTAEILLFLNNDTLITHPDWLSRMVEGALLDGVGMVGAKLLYEDGSVQHGGVVLGIQGVAAHADVNAAPDAPGYKGLARHDREVSAVTGACMACRRDLFEQVGGFDENLAVAFNDTLLCINLLKAGRVNFQLNSARLTHLESKSRGHDITPAQRDQFLRECRYTRAHGQRFFLDDVYYSPNLSLHDTYKPAPIARRRKPWRSPAFNDAPRVLILSCTHQRGHGVPVVIEQHAAYLRSRGLEVHIGGHRSDNDIDYEGCVRVELQDPLSALAYAVDNDIDIVIPHTPPFFSVSRWAGPYPFVAAYDHGEPPSSMFPDAPARDDMQREKDFSLSLMHRLYANSEPVRAESGFEDMVVVPLGNSHMDRWNADKAELRRAVRERNGWTDKVVVLNVCRFHEAERSYKGVDFFISVHDYLRRNNADSRRGIVFVQCGKALPEDVDYVSAAGIECFSNVSETEMSELYCAADIYANFSQWEGWNLGIGQALAYGLPVIASDIEAHRRNFDVTIASNVVEAGQHIAEMATAIRAKDADGERSADIAEWSDRLEPFVDDLLASWKAFPRKD